MSYLVQQALPGPILSSVHRPFNSVAKEPQSSVAGVVEESQ